MTTLSPLSAVTTSATTSATGAAGLGGMDYNAFLRLLIAQMKNQDPTQPMDNTAFVAQLATFSQVEQSIDSNKKLDSLLTSQSLSLADAVIGHKVTSPDGKIHGIVKSVVITADGPVAKLDTGDYLFLGNGIIIE